MQPRKTLSKKERFSALFYFCYCFATFSFFHMFMAYLFTAMRYLAEFLMMKKLLQSVATPLVLFTFGIVMLGCEQTSAPESIAKPSVNDEIVKDQPKVELESGNMFYLLRDIADVQLKAGAYIEQLQQTQTDLHAAVETQDPKKLELAAHNLQSQLTSFNDTLNNMRLKSQEVADIRETITQANDKVLASDFLNGKVDFKQVDFQKIEAQMTNIQTEMLKLAGMLIVQSEDKS